MPHYNIFADNYYTMFSGSVFDLIKQVVSSWQVLVISVAVILYIFLVNYVARSYHKMPKFKKINLNFRKPKAKPAAAGPDEALSGSSTNDELGLEEA